MNQKKHAKYFSKGIFIALSHHFNKVIGSEHEIESLSNIKKITECFSEDITATFASKILKLNRKTVNRYYNEFRQKILEKIREEHERELGVFELNESYFGAERIRWKPFAKSCHTVV